MADDTGVPDSTNWSQWTYANMLAAITGDKLDDLRSKLKGVQWLQFDKEAVGKPPKSGDGDHVGGYYAYGKVLFAVKLNRDAVRAYEELKYQTSVVFHDLSKGNRGALNKFTLTDLQNEVGDLSQFLSRRAGDYRQRAKNLKSDSSDIKGKAAELIWEKLDHYADMLEYWKHQVDHNYGMSVARAAHEAYLTLDSFIYRMTDVWSFYTGPSEISLTDEINRALRIVNDYMDAAGIVKGTANYKFDEMRPDDSDGYGNPGEALVLTPEQAKALVDATMRSFHYGYPPNVVAGDLRSEATWQTINHDISTEASKWLDNLDSAVRKALPPLSDAYVTLGKTLNPLGNPPPFHGTAGGYGGLNGPPFNMNMPPFNMNMPDFNMNGFGSGLNMPGFGMNGLGFGMNGLGPGLNMPGFNMNGFGSNLNMPGFDTNGLGPNLNMPGFNTNGLGSNLNGAPAGLFADAVRGAPLGGAADGLPTGPNGELLGPDGQPLTGPNGELLDRNREPLLGPDGELLTPMVGPTVPRREPLDRNVEALLGPNGEPVLGPNGELLDRNGEPLLGPNGELLGPDGQPLIGPNGELLGPGGGPLLGPNGELLDRNGQPIIGPDGQALTVGDRTRPPVWTPPAGGITVPGGGPSSGLSTHPSLTLPDPPAPPRVPPGGIGSAGAGLGTGVGSSGVEVGGAGSSGGAGLAGSSWPAGGASSAPAAGLSQLGPVAGPGEIPTMPMGGMGGMPFMPGMGGQPGGEKKERERQTWLSEDEKVWGTDVTASLGVIGRPEDDEDEVDGEELVLPAGPVRSRRPAPARGGQVAADTGKDDGEGNETVTRRG